MHAKHYLQLLGVALLVMVSNILASVLYMVLYGHVIHPGEEPAFYQRHIQVAGPYCSLIAGIPLMFAAGYWTSGWWQQRFHYRPGFVVWGWYLAIDFAILAVGGLSLPLLLLVFFSFLTKLVAILAGSRLRLRSPIQSP